MTFPSKRETVVTALDGPVIGMAPSGLPSDSDGVVRRWTLPAHDGPDAPWLFSRWASDGRVVYMFRRVMWNRGSNSGDST